MPDLTTGGLWGRHVTKSHDIHNHIVLLYLYLYADARAVRRVHMNYEILHHVVIHVDFDLSPWCDCCFLPL